MAHKKEKKPLKPRDQSPEKKQEAVEETAPEQEVPVVDEAADANGQTQSPPEPETTDAQEPPKNGDGEALAKSQAEIASLKEQYLRLAAEYDNFRKRTVREKETLYEEAVADTVKEILIPLDSLERALSFADADPKALKEGLLMVAKQMQDSLKKLGVEEIPTAEGFEPSVHNAIMHEEDDSLPPNTVAEVFQKGYKLKERVIRHSLVKVVN